MSRGVKDLRELICVSRLTVRDSDDDLEDSGSDETSDYNPLVNEDGTSSISRQSSGSSTRTARESDSGLGLAVPAVRSFSEDPTLTSDLPKSSTITTKRAKKRSKRRVKLRQAGSVFDPVPEGAGKTSFSAGSKCELPPIAARNGNGSSLVTSRSVVSGGGGDYSGVKTNFDSMMVYLDAEVVTEWLHRANCAVQEMAEWVHTGDNFVQLSHFWLREMDHRQKTEIFELEHGVLLDEMALAFKAGRETNAIKKSDLNLLSQAVIRECPHRLLGERGPYLFLDYLDVLTSERTDEYRRLLTDVRLSTRNRTYAQWFLALRSFGLMTIWSAVVNFYRELVFRGHVKLASSQAGLEKGPLGKSPRYKSPTGQVESPWYLRTVQSLRPQFLEVLHYILTTNKIEPRRFHDSEKRNLIFLAVSKQHNETLLYLIKEVHPLLNVNCVSETGNTPVHAVACTGNFELMQTLIEVGKADIDPGNSQCDDSTPLHMAVMYGHKKIVEYLLSKGADCHRKMGDIDTLQLAQDFEQTEIFDILTKHLEAPET